MVSFILFNIYNIRPLKKKPSPWITKEGSITSSIKYNNLNEGKAIKINITAGVIVQINSINVPWFIYLLDINEFLDTKLFVIVIKIHVTVNKIIAK